MKKEVIDDILILADDHGELLQNGLVITLLFFDDVCKVKKRTFIDNINLTN
jgi:hypothetical protein